MFHDIKTAGLIGPWQGMCDRAVKLCEYLFEEADAEQAVAYVEHLEILALRRIHARRDSFQEDYNYRKGHGTR